MPGDDGGADRARPRAPGVPARHRRARRHLERAVGLDAEVDHPDPERRMLSQVGRAAVWGPFASVAGSTVRSVGAGDRRRPGGQRRGVHGGKGGGGQPGGADAHRQQPGPERRHRGQPSRRPPRGPAEPGQMTRRPQAEGGPGDLPPRRRGLGRERLGTGRRGRLHDAPLGHGDTRGLHLLPGRIPPVLGRAAEHGHRSSRPAVPHPAPLSNRPSPPAFLA